MTTLKDLFAKFPRRVRNRSQKPTATFELLTDGYAIHRRGSEPEIIRDDEAVETDSGSTIGPLYAIEPSGGVAVPTGRVFIRFKAGVAAADRERDIQDAGYEIAEAVSYAPEAVWLKPPSGDIAEALNGLAKLEKLPGVENVEPQMLMQRASR